MPFLSTLSLDSVVQVTSLRKLNTPFLEKLLFSQKEDFKSFHAINYDSLSEFKSKKLMSFAPCQFSIAKKTDSQSYQIENYYHNLEFMFKMQSQFLFQIEYQEYYEHQSNQKNFYEQMILFYSKWSVKKVKMIQNKFSEQFDETI